MIRPCFPIPLWKRFWNSDSIQKPFQDLKHDGITMGKNIREKNSKYRYISKMDFFLEKFKPYNYTRNTALRTILFYFYTCKNRRTAILKYSMCKLILNFELRLRRITLEDDLLETISGTGRSNSTLQQNILLRYKYTALILCIFYF